jgi:tartrate-resistant acid phosphatase type 5
MSDAPGSPLPEDAPTKKAQLEWLEAQMAASTADYLWVGGHYPVWSGCEHGNTLELHVDLKPLLEKYHATGYMSGHDHCEEYIDDGTGPV